MSAAVMRAAQRRKSTNMGEDVESTCTSISSVLDTEEGWNPNASGQSDSRSDRLSIDQSAHPPLPLRMSSRRRRHHTYLLSAASHKGHCSCFGSRRDV